MLLEIWITTATLGMALLVLGIIYASETTRPYLLFLSAPFLLTTGLASGAIDIVRFSDGAAITETIGYGSLMMLFVALFIFAVAYALISVIAMLSSD